MINIHCIWKREKSFSASPIISLTDLKVKNEKKRNIAVPGCCNNMSI